MGHKFVVALVGLAVVALTGCPAKPVPPEVKAPPTIRSFTATPTSVAPEEGVTLSWEVEHATSVSIVRLGHGDLDGFDPAAATGSLSLQVEEDAMFVLTARGAGGSDSQAVGVTVQTEQEAKVLFAAFPEEISAGESTTLAWNAPGAKSVSLVGPGDEALDLGGQLASGAIEVRPDWTSTYVLTVDGEAHSLTVVVNPAILQFRADRGAVTQGQKVLLSWKVGGADSLTLSRLGQGVLTTATDAATLADGSFEDTVPETLPNDGYITYELTVTRGAQIVTRTLPLYVGVTPRLVDHHIPLAVLASSGFRVTWTTEQADSLELLLDGKPVFTATSAAQVRQGEFTVGAPEDWTEVRMVLRNQRGGELIKTQLVEVIGPVQFNTFEADTPVVARGGDPVTLSWNVTNARNVRIMAGGREVARLTGPTAEANSVVHYPNGPTTYTLHADNTVGSSITPVDASVTVTTPAKLTWSPAPVPEGAPVTLNGHDVVGGGPLQGLPSVVKNAPGAAFEDISTTGTKVGFSTATIATAVHALSEPFQTIVYGVPVRDQFVALNKLGFFVFSNTAKTAGTANQPLPHTGLHPLAIAPFWKHQVFNDNSAMYVQEDGPASNRRLIIQWEKMEQDGSAGSELTYQAQVYADGTIVFAYKTLRGVTGTMPSVGIIDRDETGALVPPDVPSNGDTYTFFGKTPLPYQEISTDASYLVSIPVGNPVGSHRMEVEARSYLIPPRQMFFSEVNFHPAASATEGEWIELSNPDNIPFDLDGWVLDFGNGQTHTITGPLTFPASGVLVLGQSTDTLVNGGVAVDYAYGSALQMPDTAGRVSLVRHGAVYGFLEWNPASGGAQGVSVRADPPNPDLLYAPGVVQLSCASLGNYGPAPGQTGTPGVRDQRCFPYELEFDPVGNFESIAAIGQPLTIPSLTESIVKVGPSTVPALTHPVKWGYGTYDTLYVSTNAWVAPRDSSEPELTCLSATDCYKSGKKRDTFDPATGLSRILALYWSDTNVQSGGGIYVLRRDPDPILVGDEYTILSWETMRWASTGTAYDLNWQVKFFENGDIEYHFGTMFAALNCTTNCGSSSTTWFESEDGNAALVVNVNSSSNPGIRPDTVWRFKYTP